RARPADRCGGGPRGAARRGPDRADSSPRCAGPAPRSAGQRPGPRARRERRQPAAVVSCSYRILLHPGRTRDPPAWFPLLAGTGSAPGDRPRAARPRLPAHAGRMPALREAPREALQALSAEMDLTVTVRALSREESRSSAGEGVGYILRLYGADRPGIVHAVTEVLAREEFNITDLETRVIPGEGGPVYVM